VTDDSLIEGGIYSLRWYATNAKGNGHVSDEIRVALVDIFPAPLTVTKLSSLSTETAITASWSSVTPGVSPGGNVLGYKLMIENPNTAETTVVFDGYALGLPE
jgi:hypothetical protein